MCGHLTASASPCPTFRVIEKNGASFLQGDDAAFIGKRKATGDLDASAFDT